MSILSDRLRELRGAQSQSAFAAALGMKYQQYARYEKGENSPSADILANICRIHAVSADWLLGLPKSNATVVSSSPGSIVVQGYNNSVGLKDQNICDKCPYKKKLKALEKLISK